jgi:hypothetical protein
MFSNTISILSLSPMQVIAEHAPVRGGAPQPRRPDVT